MAKKAATGSMSSGEFFALARAEAKKIICDLRTKGLADDQIERYLGRPLPAELKSKAVEVGGLAVNVADGLVYPITPRACEPIALEDLRSLSETMNDAALPIDERGNAAALIAPFFHKLVSSP